MPSHLSNKPLELNVESVAAGDMAIVERYANLLGLVVGEKPGKQLSAYSKQTYQL